VAVRARGPVATAALLACGHWAAAARAIMPRVAGGAGVPYRIAGPALAVSGSAWAMTLVLLGNRVGPHVLTHAAWVPVVVVVLLIGTLAVRARRAARRKEADEDPRNPRTSRPRLGYIQTPTRGEVPRVGV
jgi:membrane-associated protein